MYPIKISVYYIVCRARVFTEMPCAPQNLEVSDTNNDNVSLKWLPPLSDGGAELTEYVVDMKPEGSSKFTPVVHVQPETPFCTVNDLNKGDKYEFRVRAKNAVGVSDDAAELDSPVIAKATCGMSDSRNTTFTNVPHIHCTEFHYVALSGRNCIQFIHIHYNYDLKYLPLGQLHLYFIQCAALMACFLLAMSDNSIEL